MNNFLKRIIKINPLIILLILSFGTIFFKWVSSFYIYPGEGISLKNILDLEDTYYFPFIINLAELNFTPEYIDNAKIEKFLPFPFYSMMIHSLFYIFFKDFTFLIIEFLSLSLFLIILFKIFKELRLSDYISILLSVFIFLFSQIASNIFTQLNISSIHSDVFYNLYSFRFPRPIITSLYFFFNIFLLIKIFKSNKKKDNILYILLGLFLGLNLGSYYYLFNVLALSTLYVLCIKFIFKKKYFFELFQKIKFILFPFLIIATPFLLSAYFSEPDFMERIGVMELNWVQKKIILKHLFSKIFEFQFIVFFILNTFFFIYLKKSNYNLCNKTLSILYSLFISSIISPFIFIAFSPSVVEIYHFLNWIVIIATIIFILFGFIYLLGLFQYFKKKSLNNKYYENLFLFLCTIILMIFFNLNYLSKFKAKDINFRDDMKILNNFFKSNKSNLNTLMTFNAKIQTWWLFNGKNKLTTVDSSLLALTNNQLELNFVKNLKYLKISDDIFNLILKNSKQGWRYYNENLKYLSWYKYQANSMITFNASNNFDKNILNDIKQTPPTRSQQIAIPKDEQIRLSNLYKNDYESFNDEVDIIILNKNSIIGSNASIDKNKFCKLNLTKQLEIYIKIIKAKCD
jgi:hypothetical protein